MLKIVKCLQSNKVFDTMLPRKASNFMVLKPVPTTNTRNQKENFKVSETTTFKELGKIIP